LQVYGSSETKMNNLKLRLASVGTGLVGLFAVLPVHADTMATAINNGIASTTDEITSVLTTNIPVVLVVFGGLVALGIALRLVKKTIGRRA